MSAPKMDEEVRRQQAITALFTREEKQKIVKAALSHGIAPSILVRRAALVAVSQVPSAGDHHNDGP
jgi:hypothetical protein